MINFAEGLKLAQAKGARPGSFAATLLQIGAFGNLLAFQFNAAAGVIILGPFASSRLLASKAGRQWLSQGFRLPRTEAAIPAITAFFNRGVALNTGMDIIAQNFIKETLGGEEPNAVTSVQTPDGSTVTVRTPERR